MIAIIQTASKAAKTTNETQAKKAPNERLQEPYRPIAKLDNAKPVQREKGTKYGHSQTLESANRESKVTRKGDDWERRA
jgi:hypothetical protein